MTGRGSQLFWDKEQVKSVILSAGLCMGVWTMDFKWG